MSFDHRGETILIHNGLRDGRPWLDVARPVLFAVAYQLEWSSKTGMLSSCFLIEWSELRFDIHTSTDADQLQRPPSVSQGPVLD